jgi:large conductance mechanosensitive channel protein
MLSEFKRFLMRGNVVDLAVAVVVGTVFTEIRDLLATRSA